VKGGEGTQQDYGMRIYDPRLGRFLTFDPLSKEYSDLSPYHFAGNNPIQNLDKDGGEPLDYRSNWIPVAFRLNDGKPKFSREINDPKLGYISVEAYYDKWSKQSWFIHSGNDGRDYYWKHNPGEDQSVRMAGNGQWVEFKTQDKIFLEQTAQLTRGMATGFAAAMAAPFVAYGGISAAGAGIAAIENAAYSALANASVANATLAAWSRVPVLVGTTKSVLAALDESGALVGASSSAAKSFFRNPVINESISDGKRWLLSECTFTANSGLERILQFGGEMKAKGKELVIESLMYIKGLKNEDAMGELGREGLNALKSQIKEFAKERGFNKVLVEYERSAGSSSKNPGSKGVWTISVDE
jgi:hypothetical protein